MGKTKIDVKDFPCLDCPNYIYKQCHTLGGHSDVCAHHKYLEWYLEKQGKTHHDFQEVTEIKTNLKTFPSEGCADVYEWYDLMQQWKEDFEKELREIKETFKRYELKNVAMSSNDFLRLVNEILGE